MNESGTRSLGRTLGLLEKVSWDECVARCAKAHGCRTIVCMTPSVCGMYTGGVSQSEVFYRPDSDIEMLPFPFA
jgi:hypothetical protein